MWAHRKKEVYCSNIDNLHTCGKVELANCPQDGQTITFYSLASNFQESAMAIISTHEIAHAMGLPDVYQDVYNIGTLSVPHENQGGMLCIMEFFDAAEAKALYENIVYSGTYSAAFCNFCASKFFSSDYHPFFTLTKE